MLAVLFEKFQQTLVEMALERRRILEIVLAHEVLNAGIGLPLGTVVLVTSDVHEVVGEDGSHFSDESIEKFVGALPRGIHHRIEDAKLALDVERSGRAGEVRISDKPCTGMSGHVELGHDADAAVAGVGHDLTGLLLGVEETVRAQFS
jgi:hypothetical protein